MTLDEAIKHAEEVMKKDNNKLKIYELINEDRPFFIEEETECKLRADEYRQLAEWLKDYKRLLEQEPCEDCISREAVIKTIAEWLFSKEFHYTNATEYLRKRLDELPSVTPQQKIMKCTDCKYIFEPKWEVKV